MFRRGKSQPADAVGETPESIDAVAARLASQLDAERSHLAELRDEFRGANDLHERADLRARIEAAERTIADGNDRHALLRARRDRLVTEMALAALDPLRQRIAERDSRIERLTALLASEKTERTSDSIALTEAEDEIRNPEPDAQAVQWHVRQLWDGFPVDADFAHLSLATRKEIVRRLRARNAQIPAELAAASERSHDSWARAGIPFAGDLPGAPFDRPPVPVEVPDVHAKPSTSLPYFKL